MRRWLLTPLVASLFLVAFVESWAALVHAARTAGIPYPQPWPWMVDGFIVAMALMVVEADRTQRSRVVLWPRVGLVAATGLSVWVQVAYAPQGGEWLAAWSPLAVLFSFECLVWLTRPGVVVPTPLGKPVPQPAQPEPDPTPEPEPGKSGPASPSPRVTQDAPRREHPVARGEPPPSRVEEVAQRAAQGQKAAQIVREMGLSDRARKGWVADVVRSNRPTPTQMGHRNGTRPPHVTPTQVREP